MPRGAALEKAKKKKKKKKKKSNLAKITELIYRWTRTDLWVWFQLYHTIPLLPRVFWVELPDWAKQQKQKLGWASYIWISDKFFNDNGRYVSVHGVHILKMIICSSSLTGGPLANLATLAFLSLPTSNSPLFCQQLAFKGRRLGPARLVGV